MTEIFSVGKDRRKELLDAVKTGEPFTGQPVGGQKLEVFDDKLGYVLLRGEKVYQPESLIVQRIKAVIDVYDSIGRSSLRTSYYVARGNPKFAAPFKGAKIFNDVWLETISKSTEILCEVDRDKFTFGSSKGFLYYPHSNKFGDSRTLVTMTEELAVSDLLEQQIDTCQNVLVNEKMSNSTELAVKDDKFLRMTNTLISTVSGRPTRSILKLAKKYQDNKNVLLLCDGDIWGVDMREVIRRGSKNLRHQTLNQTSKKSYDVGLFPSVAERLGLPDDIDEKRPLSGNEKSGSLGMLNHLRRSGLDKRDLDTFDNDKTFELESLHSAFRSKAGELIGTQVYLTEVMRELKLNCKPVPDDKEIGNEFSDSLRTLVRRRLSKQISSIFRLNFDTSNIDDVINDTVNELVNVEMDAVSDQIDCVESSATTEELQDHIKIWYNSHATSPSYNMNDVAEKMVDNITCQVSDKFEQLKEEVEEFVREKIDEIVDTIKLDMDGVGKQITSNVVLSYKSAPKNIKSFYDVILDKLGANRKDAKRIQEAVKCRLR